VFTAFLDANVLVPIALTDTILSCAEQELFVPRWSERVLKEVRRAVLRIVPEMTEARIDYRLATMNAAFPEACVQDYESLVESIHLPDPDDRHVVAAAVRGGADVVVTDNLKHFPAETLDRLGHAGGRGMTRGERPGGVIRSAFL
jgi:predicted nucleic acid-binding protein